MLFDSKIIESIKNFLTSKGETIAVAESVTSGFLQAALSSAKDASKFYQGGMTAYNLGQKYRHLMIDPIQGETCNCVSEKIAEEMALNVCTLFKSDWGISITGYAAPVRESGYNLFAYYAVARKGKIIISGKVDSKKGESVYVQIFYVQELLTEFEKNIAKFKGEIHEKEYLQ